MEVAKTSEIGEISQKISPKGETLSQSEEISQKLSEISTEAEKLPKKEKKDRRGYWRQRYSAKKDK
jgi:hypothetical protein